MDGHALINHQEEQMGHCMDPSRLRDYSQYEAALRELEDLMLSDPDTPAGRRFDELIALVEEFDSRPALGGDASAFARVAA
jgi:hypothetical protein